MENPTVKNRGLLNNRLYVAERHNEGTGLGLWRLMGTSEGRSTRAFGPPLTVEGAGKVGGRGDGRARLRTPGM